MRVADAAGAGLRILLVEDDPGIGRFVHRGLTAEGYAVEWQTLGRRAQSRLASGQFHAAILDLGLPDADGADLCREARARGNDLPICMLTARADLEDRLDGFRCGADDYLTKPFDLPELEARVRALIRRGQAGGSSVLTHGPLALDTAGRRATLRGAPLELSARELGVLEVLLMRSGRVVGKEQLAAQLYGWEEEVGNNAIEVYVHRLRRKLEPAGVIIRTVRGLGYLLEKADE